MKKNATHRAWLGALAALLCVFLGAGGALADDTDKFRGLITEATKLAFEGKYDDAITKYIEAKTIYDDPVLDYNIARCYHQKGECEPAVRFYKRVLDNPDATEEDRKSTAGHLAELGDCKAVEVVVGPGPDPDPDPNPDPGPSDDGSAFTWAAYGTTAVGGALIVTGLAVDVASSSLIDDYKTAAEAGNAAEFDQLSDDIDSRQTTVLLLYGVGAAATLAGVVMIILDDSDDGPAVGLSPMLLEDGAGATLGGRW